MFVGVTSSYWWQHDEAQNGRGPDDESSAEDAGIEIDVHGQGVSDDDDDGSHNALVTYTATPMDLASFRSLILTFLREKAKMREMIWSCIL